jgi:type III pantothenate kinase
MIFIDFFGRFFLFALQQAGPERPQLYFCGGGGEALMALLGGDGTLAPDLVFEGLAVMAAMRGN